MNAGTGVVIIIMMVLFTFFLAAQDKGVQPMVKRVVSPPRLRSAFPDGVDLRDRPARSQPLSYICPMTSMGFRYISNSMSELEKSGRLRGTEARTCMGIAQNRRPLCGMCNKDTLFSDIVPSNECHKMKYGIEALIENGCERPSDINGFF
jgi:hypothetical protein